MRVIVRWNSRSVESTTQSRPFGKQQFGVDAVEVEGLDPRLGVVATRVDVFEPAPQTLLVGRAARARTPVERARRVAAREDPRVTLLETLHARHLVAVLRGRLRRPQVGRVHEMTVGRDQPVVVHVSLVIAETLLRDLSH